VRENDRAGRFDRELASMLGEIGYLGAPVAEEYGGRGLDYLSYALIVEQVGRADSSARTVVSVQTSLVAGSVERWGTEEQKQEWLPRLCSGEALGCFALTEPDAGSDPASMRTRAKKTDSGWTISGNKMWISMGNVSELALVFAQTDPEKKHKGLACFMVPTATKGYGSQEIHGKLGLRSSDTAEISLDDVEVPDEALLGEVGDGFKIAMSSLDNGRYSVAAGCVGICDGCVDASVEYAKERKQFGVPIASFQLVQELIADMIVKRDAARLLVYRAGGLKDLGERNTIETSIAKYYATEAAVECANSAIQVHGGSGYVDDYPVERYLRDARVTTLYEGTSQIHKLIIGRDATGINAMVPPSAEA
jgi:butyryl-CoA dehydrogenase